MSTLRVAVVGGGLAGIAAALRCADADCTVTLYESRRWLGGLTHSFRRGELSVDNGQHVFLRCCTAYRALLQRLDVAEGVTLQTRLRIPVLRPGDTTPTLLRRGRLPAPAHLAGAVLRYRPLALGERLAFGRAGLALRRVAPEDPAVDQHSFGGWLRAHGQSDRAIEALWDLVGVATLNARADQASLALAATVFRQGLLTDASAADIGWSRLPLGRLHGDAARTALAAAGATVLTGTPVRELRKAGDGWRVHTGAPEPAEGSSSPPNPSNPSGSSGSSGRSDRSGRSEAEEFDAVVLATPPERAAQLLPTGHTALPTDTAGQAALPADWVARLGSTPIVNVHAVLDRPVTEEPFVAGVGTEVQWVFDRTEPSGLRAGAEPATRAGQYLALSLSAADELVDQPARRLRERFLPALGGLLPEVRRARVLDFFVTRERTATFRQAPGCSVARPGTRTSAPGVYLAGAWTATGWPATMEGAVRSGDAAATALLDRDPHPSPTQPVPTREGVVA